MEKNEKYDFIEKAGNKESDSCDSEVVTPRKRLSDNENIESKKF